MGKKQDMVRPKANFSLLLYHHVDKLGGRPHAPHLFMTCFNCVKKKELLKYGEIYYITKRVRIRVTHGKGQRQSEGWEEKDFENIHVTFCE